MTFVRRALPGERDEYLATEDVTWRGGLRQADGDGNGDLDTSLVASDEAYRSGRSYSSASDTASSGRRCSRPPTTWTG
ncbi:hypothetical protein ACFOW4_10705 [Micromonospora sp. GCM10011542]|uniref:hypothetical protein n=1 Tax=Micromonospora sp. GCM10011542 TaxID=3317337 RepID=UPI003610575D